jgi:hypothetical protein
MTDKITVKVPRPRRRAGVMPTRKEEDRSKRIPRRAKHKKAATAPE